MTSAAIFTLDDPLSALSGVGPRREADLARLGLHTVGDLLARFPIRYEDRAHPTPVAHLKAGTTVAVSGRIVRCGLRLTRRRGFTVFEALVRDDTGTIPAVWFNQRFLRDVFATGQEVFLFGRVEARGLEALQLGNPQYEILDGGDAGPDEREALSARRDRDNGPPLHSGRIVPIYEKVGSLTAKMQRALIKQALDRLHVERPDPLPDEVAAQWSLPPFHTALREVHFPAEGTALAELNEFRTPPQRRLILEEFFAFQLGIALRRRRDVAERKPFSVVVDNRVRAVARAVLPFKLTAGQRQAVREIVEDMARPHPMNRLLQGDVGSGKTIVALLSAVVAIENGLQAAFMTPTEILAEQQVATIRRLMPSSRWRIALLTGSTPARERRDTLAALADGTVPLVVGTHALVQEGVVFRHLGLIVIDEQHRFGVLQRATLRAKGWCPDVVVMTATPIPRTLALTTYGDLDVSVIRDLPPGRTRITTVAKPESRREEVCAFVRDQVAAGRQAYIVYPLVEESDRLDVRAATGMADHLAADVFPSLRVGLLHGRMSAEGKDRVMTAFAAGQIDILVSTTVIEVGIDVPNATVMVVEHAERFGLSQLHQLRGRVGRGVHASHCVLLYQAPLSDDGRERLKVLTETGDGFVIAERDLRLRGPGDFFGTRQAGLPRLRSGDLLRDHALMEEAREAARAFVASAPPDDPRLRLVEQDWAERFGLVGVG